MISNVMRSCGTLIQRTCITIPLFYIPGITGRSAGRSLSSPCSKGSPLCSGATGPSSLPTRTHISLFSWGGCFTLHQEASSNSGTRVALNTGWSTTGSASPCCWTFNGRGRRIRPVDSSLCRRFRASNSICRPI